MLTKDAILAVDDIKTEELSVHEWGGSIFVRTMSAADFSEAQKAGGDDDVATMIALVAIGVCDKDGNRLFTSKDVVALREKNGAVMRRIAEAVMDINGIREEDIEEKTGN